MSGAFLHLLSAPAAWSHFFEINDPTFKVNHQFTRNKGYKLISFLKEMKSSISKRYTYGSFLVRFKESTSSCRCKVDSIWILQINNCQLRVSSFKYGKINGNFACSAARSSTSLRVSYIY